MAIEAFPEDERDVHLTMTTLVESHDTALIAKDENVPLMITLSCRCQLCLREGWVTPFLPCGSIFHFYSLMLPNNALPNVAYFDVVGTARGVMLTGQSRTVLLLSNVQVEIN